MKIYSYVYNGKPVTDDSRYDARRHKIPSQQPPWIVGDAAPDGYVDVTSIPLWDRFFQEELVNRDYKFIRTGIAEVVATSGWEKLSTSDKEIAARWFVVGADQRTEVYTLDEQVQLGVEFHSCSVKAREARFKVASAEIYNRLSRPEQTVIVGEAEAGALPKLYVQYGIEGTQEGDVPGLFDYLEGRDKTPYAGSGLLQKNFVPSGITMPQLVDKVMSILVSGLYDYSPFR